MGTDDEVTTDARTTEDRGGGRASSNTLRIASERYRIGERIGHGGMGEVVAARDEEIGREVAIKRLRTREPSERQVTRFLHEARIQGRLDHPAIVPVHELGRDADGLPFFAMKKLAGTTLSDILRADIPTRQRLLRAFADVCLAVEFAHVHGVIHRDLKPENIVLGDYGEVYVLDWGVAKVAGESDDFEDLRGPGTIAGAAIGTPAYMAPEQVRDSSSVDARADVFSLGKVLALILASEDDPPPELVAVAAAATAEDRDARIATARALADEIQRYLDGDRDLALRKKLARDHLDHARAAFAHGLSDEDRGVAIRAASSAMALDPMLDGAAELVGRLMLEPPREMPPAAERAIAADETSWMYAQGKAANRSNIVGLALAVPTLIVMGTPRGAAAYGAFAVLAGIANWLGLRNRDGFKPAPSVVLALVNAIGIAIMAHLFGPMIVAPPMAAMIAFVLSANPLLEKRGAIVAVGALLALGVVGPLVAEQLGLLATTMEVTPGGLLIHPPAHTAPSMLVPATAILALGTIAIGIVVGRSMRAHERVLRRQLHLQAWQLRQLVTG